MRAGLSGYRIAILAGISLLLLLLAITVPSLLSQLRDLSVAEQDNPHWSITQIDTEFANLNASLSKRLSDGALTDDDIRLRLDIAISRLGILNSGRAAALFADSDAAPPLIAPINKFVERAIGIADNTTDFTDDDVRLLRTLTENVRSHVRKVALLGLEISAERSQARRAEFSQQLGRTGGIAVALLVMMAGFMLLLDRLLRRAARRDAELLTSSKLLESTVAASLDAIVTANDKGEIIGFNTAAEEVFGWSRAEIIGNTMDKTIIPHRMRDAHLSGMERYLNTGVPHVVDGGRIELAALRKSGEEFPVEINITSIESDEGMKFIAYLRDISELKINEQKLIDARDRAERTDKAKSQFLTVMSHEMRTPLNGILGVLDLLKTTKLTEKQGRYTKIAAASGEVLLEHINEALDITRIETGSLQLTPQDFDLPELITSLADVLAPLADEKNLGFTWEIDETMRMAFHGDNNRIRQILTNLIGNAIKFTDNGLVSLTVGGIHGPVVSSLKFDVTDTGKGISIDHQEQVFEDFVALAHGEGRQSRGDGLGLGISRRIAREMGGDISVTSEIGEGSTFTLTVPLQRGATQPLAKLPKENEAITERFGALDILVVEDNSINRNVLHDMLHGMGHRVVEAANGAECLEHAKIKRFDLIFMDISMPVMDGIEATRRLRAQSGPNKSTHVVGLTAHGREEYRDQATVAGMTSFHTKPIRLDALHGILGKASGKSTQAPAAADAIHELCAALGHEKVQQTGDRFFSELDAFIRALVSGKQQTDLAETAHRLKGAASMLGQSALEHPLEELETVARTQTLHDASDRGETLKKIAASARADFVTKIENYRN